MTGNTEKLLERRSQLLASAVVAYIDVRDIKNHPCNRRISEEQLNILKASFDEHGIDTEEAIYCIAENEDELNTALEEKQYGLLTLLNGHHRLKVYKDLLAQGFRNGEVVFWKAYIFSRTNIDILDQHILRKNPDKAPPLPDSLEAKIMLVLECPTDIPAGEIHFYLGRNDGPDLSQKSLDQLNTLRRELNESPPKREALFEYEKKIIIPSEEKKGLMTFINHCRKFSSFYQLMKILSVVPVGLCKDEAKRYAEALRKAVDHGIIKTETSYSADNQNFRASEEIARRSDFSYTFVERVGENGKERGKRILVLECDELEAEIEAWKSREAARPLESAEGVGEEHRQVEEAADAGGEEHRQVEEAADAGGEEHRQVEEAADAGGEEHGQVQKNFAPAGIELEELIVFPAALNCDQDEADGSGADADTAHQVETETAGLRFIGQSVAAHNLEVEIETVDPTLVSGRPAADAAGSQLIQNDNAEPDTDGFRIIGQSVAARNLVVESTTLNPTLVSGRPVNKGFPISGRIYKISPVGDSFQNSFMESYNCGAFKSPLFIGFNLLSLEPDRPVDADAIENILNWLNASKISGIAVFLLPVMSELPFDLDMEADSYFTVKVAPGDFNGSYVGKGKNIFTCLHVAVGDHPKKIRYERTRMFKDDIVQLEEFGSYRWMGFWKDLVANSECESVLDLFSGAGDLAVTAALLGKPFLAFDESDEKCEKLNERLVAICQDNAFKNFLGNLENITHVHADAEIISREPPRKRARTDNY